MKLHSVIVTLSAWLVAAVCLAPVQAAAQGKEPGLTVRLFSLAETVDRVPQLAPYQSANADAVSAGADIPLELLKDPEGGPATLVVVEGYLRVDEPGVHTFKLDASGPIRMKLGLGTFISDSGEPMKSRALVARTYPVEFRAVLSGPLEGRRLRVLWNAPGGTSSEDASEFSVIPAELFETDKDITRLTSPGFKGLKSDFRAGDRTPVSGVHPGWDVFTLHTEDGFNPMVGSMAFLPDGRLVVGTMNPLQRSNEALPDIEEKEPDKLYAFSNVTGDSAEDIEVTVVADGLAEPMGLCVVEGDLYVAQRKEITRLLDADGDGFFEVHEPVASGWTGWNYHEFTLELVERGGRLYSALSTPMAPPKWEGMRANSAPGGPLRGSLLEIELGEGGSHRHLAGGLRTPNGLGVGPDDELFYTDNQGTWMPANVLAKVEPGRFYGHYNNDGFVEELVEHRPTGGSASILAGEPRVAPVAWLPQSDVSNSPTTPLLVKDGVWAGQLLIGELTAGGIRRVFLDDVNGTTQGAVFRFTQGLESGINRMVWGPDGSLYVGGIGAERNWAWKNTRRGLQRLKPNGKEVFEMLAVRATPDGFEIEYTQPVASDFLANPENFTARQWRYEPTQSYGGPKIDDVELEVIETIPSEDNTRVRLVVPEASTGHVVYLVADAVSDSGEQVWATEAWYTLNVKPLAAAPGEVQIADRSFPAEAIGPGAALPTDAVSLLGRGHLRAWKVGGREGAGPNLEQDDLIGLPGEATIDSARKNLQSRSSLGDVRLHLEWFAPEDVSPSVVDKRFVLLQGQHRLPLGGPADGGDRGWQSYDIWFHAARQGPGVANQPARMTVLHNGAVLHDNVELEGLTQEGRQVGASVRADGVVVGPLGVQANLDAGDAPLRLRNIWVAPLEPTVWTAGPWEDLFDGKTLNGWRPLGGVATYEVIDGVIVGTTKPNTRNSFLSTVRNFEDFELEFEARIDVELNSGVQFRSLATSAGDPLGLKEDPPRDARVRGLQLELDSTGRRWSGGIYGEGGRKWVASLAANPAARNVFKRGEWNRFRLRCADGRIETWVNDVPAAVLFDQDVRTGLIGLQVHGVRDREDPLLARWRNIRVRTLTPSAP